MFWVGVIVGIFFGFNLGIVVAGLLWSVKKNDAEDFFNPIFDGLCRNGGVGDAPGVPAPTSHPTFQTKIGIA